MKSFKLIAILFLAASIFACSSDDDNHQPNPDTNYFTYNGNIFSLKDGVIENAGNNDAEDGSNTYYIGFSTAELFETNNGNFFPEKNLFSIVNFNLVSQDGHKPKTGVYNYNEDYHIDYTYKDGISFINLNIDWDQYDGGEIDLDDENVSWDDIVLVEGGTVEVNQSGNTYEVNFELLMNNQKTIKGNYTGPLKTKIQAE